MTVYGQGCDALWALISEVCDLLGPTQLAAMFPQVSRDTRWGMRRGRAPLTAGRQAEVISRLRMRAARALGTGRFHRDMPAEAWLTAYRNHLAADPRRCEACESPLPPDRSRWCDEACRSRGRRITARPEPVPVTPRRTPPEGAT